MSFERFGKQIAEGTAETALRERTHATFGTRGDRSTFYRFIILDAIFDPSIIDDAKIAYWEHTLGVTNIKFAKVLPRNAVIAQRVLEGTASSIERPMFLFPFFAPSLSMPCNPGEHIWVMFEDLSNKQPDIGYWLSKIVGPGFVEDVNHTHMPRIFDGSFTPSTKDTFEGNNDPRYQFRPGKVVDDDGVIVSTVETSTVATEDEKFYEKLMTESDAGTMRTYEAVPRYRKRPSDVVIEGTNNALVVLGQHRTGVVADWVEDEQKGHVPKRPQDDLVGQAGSIDLVVGRGQTKKTAPKIVQNSLGKKEVAKGVRDVVTTEGDPDLANDRSRIMLSQRSKVDVDLGLSGFNGSIGVEDGPNGDGAIVVKTDKIRLIARSDVEILVSGFTRDNDGKMVSSENPDDYAAIMIKSNGDIVFRPSTKGVLKWGGEDADKAVVCTDSPATVVNGNVTATPLITTMGGQFASTGIAGQGTYAKKVLVKG